MAQKTFPTNYSEKTSISDDDLLLIADSNAGNKLKKVRKSNLKIKYTEIIAEADLYKYSIVPSITSGNLTVALKNYLGQNPSITTPVKVQIGSEVRTITGPLGMTINVGTNWLNMGSSELATKEVDLFTYLRWDSGSSSVRLDISRYPSFTSITATEINGYALEKGVVVTGNSGSGYPHNTVNIGRFSSILSPGPGYTWSTPSAGFQVINHYINETKSLQSLGMAYSETGAFVNCTSEISYKLIGNKMFFSGYAYVIDKGTGGGVIYVNLPFNSNQNYSTAIGNGRTEGGAIGGKMIVLQNYAYNKNCAIFTYDNQGTISNGTASDFNGFTNI